ncbi:zinc-binding alcohol dehydrogenase family protein [Oharaeibacter diazotrophicus]|uniref:2-desacetyl-2-hydroxyethyl bacteriochlorophyllide A dehydrogenase n=1 Tax=Oharaeibacter diazotrophicus TaxID=1920512 RepID=A0A4R6RMB2_9HYPH|nr:zinc-binding alcohol dehydrogenase family protein [Oharaeibacter diazotrophicus]TDP87799.1 2-desacetyl-2-hydroxyethyl bacteriochlorophyllide A dehydrogenase [Oharaeibacter diazotrophicus]BBE74619.1 putative L-galactonate oxidoreductase [Pleomorphomonas sp. SM30]GLS76994.1 dehydrogenase [Oharaeibacter diazotrophicus]
MKALVCEEPGRLRLDDRPEPGSPPPGWALVSVSHVGICGTDYHIYGGKHPFLNYPRVMGHEVSGRVVAVGADVAIAPGSPVVVNPYVSCGHCGACRKGKPNCCTAIAVLGVHTDGAMCERVLVPAGNLYPAAGITLEQAATVEFLAIGAHGVRRSGAAPGATALVIGAGPIGLGTALFARIAGQRVTLLDTSVERLAFARDALGFDDTLLAGDGLADRVAAHTGGEGFDVVYDATGAAPSIEAAFAHVGHGGTLVLLSVVRDTISFSDPEFHKREMTLHGSRNATRVDFDHVLACLKDGRIDVAPLITHRTTLAGAADDLPRWASEKTGLVKAMIVVDAA